MTRGEVTRTARQKAGRKQDRHNGAGSESFRLSYEVGSYLSIGGGKKARVAKRKCLGPGDLRSRLEHFLRRGIALQALRWDGQLLWLRKSYPFARAPPPARLL